MGWVPGGSPSPTSIRRRSASGRQINSATRCCTPFDGVELDGRQPKQSLHDNNIICLSALRPPPSRSLAPVECFEGHRLAGEAWLEFWKTALNRSDWLANQGRMRRVASTLTCWRTHAAAAT